MSLATYKILVLFILSTCLFRNSFCLINGTVLADTRLLNGKYYTLDYSTKASYIVEIIKNGLHLCGGVLLKPSIVITAARCISLNEYVSNLERFHLIAGNQKRNQGSEPWFVQHRSIAKATLHLDWPKDQSADLALLKTSKDFQMTDYVNFNSILLPSNTLPFPFLRHIYGWGFTERNMYSSVLRFAETQYQPPPDCSHLSNSTKTLCLWSMNSGPCFGDFGGPVVEVATHYTGNDVFTISGIVSFINGARIPGDPSKVDCFNDKRAIAVRLEPFLNWINSTIDQLNGN